MVASGEAVGLARDGLFNDADGNHEYTLPPYALNCTDLFMHMAVSLFIENTGSGRMLILIESLLMHALLSVTLT